MKNLFLSTVILFALSTTSSYAQFGDLLKKAEQKIKGEVKNKVATSTPDANDLVQPDACITNVQGRTGGIINQYYVEYKEDKNYIQKTGKLWFIRKDMEVARFYYTAGEEGCSGGGRACEKLAKVDPRYVELKPLMEDAEKKTIEMEKAKGYEFVKLDCTTNTIQYKDLKTGKILTPSESGRL
jgi:hypothetical protein